MPDRFRVAPPFGVEKIQAFAYVGEPPPLKTRHETIAGMPYEVVDESLASAVANFKGFVRESDGKDENATAHLTLTTMPRP